MEMYSIHNEGYSAVAERFIRILRKKVCKYITSVSKNLYIDKLDYIVTKNGTIHAIAQIKWRIITKIIRKILNSKLLVM